MHYEIYRLTNTTHDKQDYTRTRVDTSKDHQQITTFEENYNNNVKQTSNVYSRLTVIYTESSTDRPALAEKLVSTGSF